jgi:hypothetical protein
MCGLRVVIIIWATRKEENFTLKKLMFCLSLLVIIIIEFYWLPLSGERGGGGRETAEHVVGMFSHQVWLSSN